MEALSDEMVDPVARNDVRHIAELLDAGADVNARNEQEETAFSYACANNRLAAAELLFSRGADINTIDAGGGTPLDWAVCWSSPEFHEWLTGIGGKRNDTGCPPWMRPLPWDG